MDTEVSEKTLAAQCGGEHAPEDALNSPWTTEHEIKGLHQIKFYTRLRAVQGGLDIRKQHLIVSWHTVILCTESDWTNKPMPETLSDILK